MFHTYLHHQRHYSKERGKNMKRLKFGEILVDKQLVSHEQLMEALERQKVVKKKLGEILLDMKVISEREMLQALADELQFEYLESPSQMVDISLREIVPQDFAESKGTLPLYIQDG